MKTNHTMQNAHVAHHDRPHRVSATNIQNW